MKQTLPLTPTEYGYLHDPLRANGIDLLKFTLKDLCLKEVIEIETRWIVIDSHLRKKRPRFFFKRAQKFSSYVSDKKYEKFVLDLFDKREEFRFYTLRQHIKKEFKKKGMVLYKNKYVLPELRKQNLTSLYIFSNANAKSLCENITKELELIEQIVSGKFNYKLLSESLEKVGNTIVHLEPETLDKVLNSEMNLAKVSSLSFLEILNKSFEQFEHFFHSSSFGFSVGMSGFSGGYGGFGGGSFGGGGAIGSW